MAGVREIVEAKIAGKKVMVFSKSYCPFCSIGKNTLQKYIGKELSVEEYEVWEIENEESCTVIQAILKQLTGSSTVPCIFVKGKWIGGGSETAALHKSGKLLTLLTS